MSKKMFSSNYAPNCWFSLPTETCYSPYPCYSSRHQQEDNGWVGWSPSPLVNVPIQQFACFLSWVNALCVSVAFLSAIMFYSTVFNQTLSGYKWTPLHCLSTFSAVGNLGVIIKQWDFLLIASRDINKSWAKVLTQNRKSKGCLN